MSSSANIEVCPAIASSVHEVDENPRYIINERKHARSKTQHIAPHRSGWKVGGRDCDMSARLGGGGFATFALKR